MKLPLITKKEIAPGLWEMSFDTAGGGFSFTAGQHVRLVLPRLEIEDTKGPARLFSIASSPNDKKLTIVFRVSESGFKKTLVNTPLGMELEVEGPWGTSFTLPNSSSKDPLICIAGGTGIAPFLSIIRFATEEKLTYAITLLYTARNSESLIYLKELEELAKHNLNLKVATRVGSPDREFIRKNAEIGNGSIYYISGPSKMIDATISELDKLGVSGQKMYFEEWSEICFRQMLGSLLPDNPDGVVVTDLSGYIRYLNPSWEVITGWKAEEVIGKFTPRILKSGQSSPEFYQNLWQKKLLGSKPFRTTLVDKRKDGTLYDADDIFFPLKNWAGKVFGFVAFQRDVSAQKKMEHDLKEHAKELEDTQKASLNLLEDLEEERKKMAESKAKDEAILGSIGDAVMACDKDGRVMLFNGVAEELTGFSVKEVIDQHYGQSLKFVKESDGKPGNDFISEAITIGQATKMVNHTLLITKDGRKIPVADSAAPIKNAAGEIIGCVVVFRDVTRERDVDKAKTEFVSLASHQLRTPLTSINWYIEMLQAGDAGALNDKQKEFLSEVYKGSRRMVQLVSDLLNVSRLESGRLKIEPVPTDLIEFISEVRKEVEPLVQNSGCQISFDFPKNKIAQINADKILLRQVIINLLTNAIRYSSAGKNGQVIVSLAVSPKECTITVKDNGIGIPKGVQGRIFEKFFRADNARATVADGNGLGLYLAKQIMHSSGGTIGFSSEGGQGTTFYVTIPVTGMKSKQGEKGLEG